MYLNNQSRQSLCAKTGHISQIAGFKKYILQEGKKQGVTAVDIWNGTGLYFTIVCDRASDITALSFQGKSLCWISSLGVSAPGYLQDGSLDWNENFSGGMLATCGLTTAGLPSTDNGQRLKLHGPIANLPSEEICCRTYWQGDDFFVNYTAKTYQVRPFGEYLALSRSITVKMGDNTVYLQDSIQNMGFSPEPLMLIYHMNFGYPLLDEGAKLYLTYDQQFPTSSLAEETKAQIGCITGPDQHYQPRAYNHSVKADTQGFAHATIANEALHLGATVKFKADTLNQFNLWKCLQKGSYVVGLEPCNCRTWGRDKARENGALSMLDTGKARSFM